MKKSRNKQSLTSNAELDLTLKVTSRWFANITLQCIMLQCSGKTLKSMPTASIPHLATQETVLGRKTDYSEATLWEFWLSFKYSLKFRCSKHFWQEA